MSRSSQPAHIAFHPKPEHLLKAKEGGRKSTKVLFCYKDAFSNFPLSFT
jgi:hypothetical protein